MDLTNKRVLVVGGAGFIGSHVVHELLKSPVAAVTVFDNFSRGRLSYISESLRDPRCQVFPDGGDIREVDILNSAVSQHHAVVHLAALWLLHCNDYPRTAFDVNVQGTFNVLEACVAGGVERLVYSSSASVYGDAIEVPMREDHPFMNRNFYGATKIAGEAMCRAFHTSHGLPYVGLRYMNVYGPHQDQTAAYTGVIPIMLNKIDAGLTPVINGDGSQAYDFISVQDAARANVAALQSEASDDFYNVGTGIQTSVRELCDLLLELTGSALEIEYRPYAGNDTRGLISHRVGATEKAHRELSFRFTDTLEEGLLKLIRWRESSSDPTRGGA